MSSATLPDRADLRAPLRWRVAALLATLVAVVLLGFVVATWGWRWLGPSGPPAAVPPNPDRWASAITGTPLFGRGPAVPAAPGASSTPTASAGDVRLLGVFSGSGGAGYALLRLGERGSVLVKAGAAIADDVILIEVRPDRVRIRDRGELRELRLRADTAAAPVASMSRTARAACAGPAGYKGPVYRLNAELLAGAAAQPQSWRTLLTAAADGLAVREGNGLAAMLGMKPGDRVMQANGIALASVDDMRVAFVNPLVASQPVHVIGTRDGKPAEWLFVNAGACPG